MRVFSAQGGRSLRLKAWNFIERAAELAPGAKIEHCVRAGGGSVLAVAGVSGMVATLRDLAPVSN